MIPKRWSSPPLFHCYEQGSDMRPGWATELCIGVGFPSLLLWNLSPSPPTTSFSTVEPQRPLVLIFLPTRRTLLAPLMTDHHFHSTSTPSNKCCGEIALNEVTEAHEKTCRLLLAAVVNSRMQRGKLYFHSFCYWICSCKVTKHRVISALH